jgi:hypothetical protein
MRDNITSSDVAGQHEIMCTTCTLTAERTTAAATGINKLRHPMTQKGKGDTLAAI